MKKYLLLILLAACSTENPKVAIVERQKEIKIEIKAIIAKYQNENEPAPEVDRDGNTLAGRLQYEYDSLEIELKKY